MKFRTVVFWAIVVLVLVTLLKETGIGDKGADIIENPGNVVPNVEIGK